MAEKNLAWDYAEKILDKVSRTFALNIHILGRKLQRPVLLAYLYMRMADTIEDEEKFSAEEKADLLGKFKRIFKGEDLANSPVNVWLNNAKNNLKTNVDIFTNSLPPNWKNSDNDEYALCANANVACPLLFEFSPAVIDSVSCALLEMCNGMAKFAGAEKLTIETEKDLDEYCYYVAGLVGNMLTDLFYSASPFISAARHKKLRELSVSFGLALQIVNITKDIQSDAERGVCFVPLEFCKKQGINSVEELFSENTPQKNKNAVAMMLVEKAKRHLTDAKNYIKLLPRVEHRMRLFCLLPSLMAVDNLRVIGDGSIIFEKGKRAKISRESVKKIIRNATLFGWSNLWVEKQFQPKSA